jgi:hypothetical protein
MNKQRGLMMGICMTYLACASPVRAAGEENAPLLCAPGEPIQCESKGECAQGTIQGVRLPRFIRVDFAAQQLSGAVEGGKVVTAIQNRQQLDGMLVLQGTENGRGWSMAINEKSGDMTLTVSGDQVGFVVFGACTRLDGTGKE